MDSKSYLVLNAWLQKSDQNYISGRILWLNSMITGACNLLWLSLEQMIKILILQKDIETNSKGTSTLGELHEKLDLEARKINHNVSDLIQKISLSYADLNIAKFKQTLEKLNEYFYRRYVIHKSSSISLLMINEIDELYFILREKVDPDIDLGTIDEIYIQKKHNWGHPLPTFVYAYLQNQYFRTRKHKEIVYSSFDGSGKTYREDGT